MVARAVQVSLIVCVFKLLTVSASGQTTGCPAHSHPKSENETTVFCVCDEGYVKSSGACQPLIQNPVVPNLATDPNAALLSAAQLRLVDGRIANLQKAIALLGDSNPEWAHERNRVLEDMHEDVVELSWEGVNLVTIG